MSLFLKAQVMFLFSAETVGAAMYHKMAEQYSSKPEKSRLLQVSGDHEAKHGRLFNNFYAENFGSTLGGEDLLEFIGKTAAVCSRIVPLRLKVWAMSLAESFGVRTIQIILEDYADAPLNSLLKEILAEEEFHAALYKEMFA